MEKSTNKRDQPYGVRLAGYETEKSKLPKDLTDQEYAEKIRDLANKWRV